MAEFPEDGFLPEEREKIREAGEELVRRRYLYRFMSLAGERFKWFVDVALLSQLYFSTLKGLNDPFEGAIYPTDEGTDEEKRAHWMEVAAEKGIPIEEAKRHVDHILGLSPEKRRQLMRQGHDEVTRGYGVLCLSTEWNDLPMWAYYGDAHRGVCLRFRSEMFLQFHDGVPAFPVSYEPKYPDVSYYRATDYQRTVLGFATKARVWEHESEWRVIRPEDGPMSFDPTMLDGVIMGCRISQEDEDRVRAILSARDRKIVPENTEMADREFGLVIRENADTP